MTRLRVRRGSQDRGVSIDIDPSTQSLLWSETDDRRVKDPDGRLLDAITAGELDEHLVAIADAVHARRQLLHTVRSAQAIAELCVGDMVMFTNRIRPRYLEHELAEVTEVGDRTVTVHLWRPVGRFGEDELRCPPLALRKLDRRTSIPHR
jgi:xanthine/CO dehydrogenase XdhC/CoxF family maturation factor